MSKRALLSMLAVLALALAVGVVATAKQTGERSPALADQLASARLATAKYATNLGQTKADGYRIITRMIPDMGWHFMNPKVQGFDVRRPPILVYERKGSTWQLAALEWASPRGRPSHRCRVGATARSPRRATTPTGHSCSRPPRIAAHTRALRPAPPSSSGTRTS
jgi:hypothetical protein